MPEPSVVPPAAAPKPRRTGLLATAVAVPVLLIGGGAYAYQQLNGGGTQPDEVLPSTVIAYARLDANPSASQKIKLFKLLRKSPDLAKEIGIETDAQDLRKNLVEGILSDCKSIDYAKDIKPWIGDRVGVGVTDPRGDNGLVALQVSDEKAARKGIDLAAGCLGLSDPGVAFSKGYAVIGNTQKDVDTAVKAAATKTLSAAPAFAEDMENLGDGGIASVWVSAKAFLSEFAGDLPDAASRKQVDNIRSAALTLRAGDNTIELTGVGHTNTDIGKPATVDLGDLPEASVLTASFAGGGQMIGSQWDSLNLDLTKGIEEETGFKLPEDLQTLFGDNFTLVVGDSNLASLDSLEGPGDVAKLDAAIAMRSTTGPATELAHRIAREVAKFTGIELAVVSTDKGAVLATNEDFARNFKGGKKLAGTDEFSSVIDNKTSIGGGLFVDLAQIIKTARGADLSPSDKKDLDQLKDLKAFGFSTAKDGDRVVRGTLKLSFK